MSFISKLCFKALRRVWLFCCKIIQGDGVSSLFFKRHMVVTTFSLVCGVLVISMRFDCLTNENRVDRLNDSINIMRTEKQRQRSRYMTLIRESAMIHLVDSLKLGLALPDAHAQEIHIPANEL